GSRLPGRPISLRAKSFHFITSVAISSLIEATAVTFAYMTVIVDTLVRVWPTAERSSTTEFNAPSTAGYGDPTGATVQSHIRTGRTGRGGWELGRSPNGMKPFTYGTTPPDAIPIGRCPMLSHSRRMVPRNNF